jgi:NADH-quinone oxidoreductase subunit N
MTAHDLFILSPLLVLVAASLIITLAIAFFRERRVIAILTTGGLSLSLLMTWIVSPSSPRQVTPLLIIDHYALFFTGLIIAAGIAVTLVSFDYLEKREGIQGEYSLLLILATLGSAVLAASNHFASFFLGLEILSVSIYALIGYLPQYERTVEAAAKYLILAGVSAAFLLFGMALVYAELGTMELAEIVSRSAGEGVKSPFLQAGFGMIIVGIGFKLALAPFHLWTPDVYEGAPAPVTSFVATVSKGSVFALLLRYFSGAELHVYSSLFLVFAIVALLSMIAGNLLALLQNNIKRILAYSSIAHLGYLLVAFLASGSMRGAAVAFYLAVYFVATLGAFGVIALLSKRERDADSIDDYRGLAFHRPWLAAVFTLMILSLAGMPLTAGFIGKFYVVAAGIQSSLWLLIVVLVIASAIGLFYYLRIIAVLYVQPEKTEEGRIHRPSRQKAPIVPRLVLAALAVLLVWLGMYPAPVIETIQRAVLR